jgi:hypothetical protein
MVYTMVYTVMYAIVWHGIYGWYIPRYIRYGIYHTQYAIYNMLCRTYHSIYHWYKSWYIE